MSSNFTKITSKIIFTTLIVTTCLFFALSGYQGGMGSVTSIAKVGSLEIGISEFEQGYRARTQGQDVNAKQMPFYQQQVLDGMIEEKLMTNLAMKLNLGVSNNEVTQQIQELPYFKPNNFFDIETYKKILSQNGLTPSDFENDIAQRIKTGKLQQLLMTPPISDKLKNEIYQLSQKQLTTTIVTIDRSRLKKHLPISKNEIDTFLNNKENVEKIKSVFEARKNEFNRPEEVKASHILIQIDPENPNKAKDEIEKLSKEVNPKNFSNLAQKNTQDPSGKSNGGSLGWFGKGKMAPEFEEAVFKMKIGTVSTPVKTNFGYHLIYLEDKKEAINAKFEDFQQTLATEQIQNDNPERLNQFFEKTKTELSNLLKAGKINEIEIATKSLNLDFEKNKVIGQFDDFTDEDPMKLQMKRLFGNNYPGDSKLTQDQINQLFKLNLDTPQYQDFSQAAQSVLVLASLNKTKKETKAEEEIAKLETIQRMYGYTYFSKIKDPLVENLKKDFKVKQYHAFN